MHKVNSLIQFSLFQLCKQWCVVLREDINLVTLAASSSVPRRSNSISSPENEIYEVISFVEKSLTNNTALILNENMIWPNQEGFVVVHRT